MELKKVFEIIRKVKNKNVRYIVFADDSKTQTLYTTFDCDGNLWEIEKEYIQCIGYKNTCSDILTQKDGIKELFKYLRVSDENSDFYFSHAIERKPEDKKQEYIFNDSLYNI